MSFPGRAAGRSAATGVRACCFRAGSLSLVLSLSLPLSVSPSLSQPLPLSISPPHDRLVATSFATYIEKLRNDLLSNRLEYCEGMFIEVMEMDGGGVSPSVKVVGGSADERLLAETAGSAVKEAGGKVAAAKAAASGGGGGGGFGHK